ncbi:hypothetical protein M970_091780 [Encephalitozoon cuniculi EcunIII-L]|uniref:Guanine nucleotide-binding protein beta subunit n=1 Tax=Encephalitozoon cuniculi TaxID=6035 RepID=M1KAF8_ENCCN|nr:guanine nucleotide-binding protein beta subunit [Encephalitozoon cuniculi]KMV65358.1 hypothetical protein M970_091780 [Encephalitozoon cuniculi EcunIII-L]UYI26874.1 hypothetical protein J0A71_03g07120 [Encephalitozoon cuniculi]
MSPTIKIPDTHLESMSICNECGIVSLSGKRTSVIVKYNGDLRIVQRILDEHPEESFECSEILKMEDDVFLVLGGRLGVIKILNLSKGMFTGYIRAHGGSISAIKGYKDRYVLSCSEDTTVKMWDISEMKCVCVFGGYMGHRDHVLSIDISGDLRYLASGGTDCSIMVWRIPSFPNKLECVTPVYSSTRNHRFPVQCVRFYGELLVSYSGEGRICAILPKYGEARPSLEETIVGEIKLQNKLLRKFDVCGDMLVALLESQDIVTFNLSNIESPSQSTILKSIRGKRVQDFCVAEDKILVLLENSCLMVMAISW